MKITLLCGSKNHPAYPFLKKWQIENSNQHEIALVTNMEELPGGDFLFLISSSEILANDSKDLYSNCLILHASKLPKGRGWSPYIWELIGGAKFITISLIEASLPIDSGKIWLQSKISIDKSFIFDEINSALVTAELKLINHALDHYRNIIPKNQDETIMSSYYPRRTPLDSQIDPNLSIASQFDLIRVCDPHRYPAFFFIHGHKYKITIEKILGDKSE
jgi:methionyl-tRNA formyltransferase